MMDASADSDAAADLSTPIDHGGADLSMALDAGVDAARAPEDQALQPGDDAAQPDAAMLDFALPIDMSVPPDITGSPDITRPPDMTSKPDLAPPACVLDDPGSLIDDCVISM